MSSAVTAWVAIGVSSGSLVTSMLALTVVYANYRASGPRVNVVSHALQIQSSQDWLKIVLANAGRTDVDIEGAWSNWLGSSVTELPLRLASGSSCFLVFRGVVPPPRLANGPLTVSVGLGNGATLLRRITLTEAEQGLANLRQHDDAVQQGIESQSGQPRDDIGDRPGGFTILWDQV
jgi:hypothetical protein